MTEAEVGLILPEDVDPRSTVEAVRTRLEKKQGSAEFSITLGDITKADVDAIVCPSNPGLEFAGFGGVQLAISRKSGMETFQEAKRKAQEYVKATGGVAFDESLRGVPLGFASATTAGELRRIKSIIHVNSMRSERDKPPCDEEVVRLSVFSALTEADRVGLRSVAFPAIGTGIWGMSLEESLRGTVQGVKDHFEAQPNSKIEKSTFVVYAPATSENARSLQETLFNRVLPSFSKEKPEISVKEVFSSLSAEGQKLLIAMCHPAETGIKKEAIVAFSGIEEKKLDSAMEELGERGLLESGSLEEGKFVVGEGSRYRLPPKVKEQVLRDVLKL